MRKPAVKTFTLVEIMIVVTIVLLLSGIAIPNLLRTRAIAQEDVAMGALRSLLSVEAAYRATHPRYANLTELCEEYPPYIDAQLASGNKQGYTFSIGGVGSNFFYITAAPQILSQAGTFYGDEDGVICRSNTSGTAAPGAHAGAACPAGFSETE